MPKSVQDAAKAEQTDASGQSHCAKCGVETGSGPNQIPGQTDHIEPRSTGGNATLDNAQHVCATCNQSAGARPEPKTTGAEKIKNQE